VDIRTVIYWRWDQSTKHACTLLNPFLCVYMYYRTIYKPSFRSWHETLPEKQRGLRVVEWPGMISNAMLLSPHVKRLLIIALYMTTRCMLSFVLSSLNNHLQTYPVIDYLDNAYIDGFLLITFLSLCSIVQSPLLKYYK
jgi:hypothetical protein